MNRARLFCSVWFYDEDGNTIAKVYPKTGRVHTKEQTTRAEKNELLREARTIIKDQTRIVESN